MLALCAAMTLLCGCALADAWTGSTVAAEMTDVVSPADGVLESFSLLPGQRVEAGDPAGRIRETPVFSPIDGQVAAIHATEGDELSGTVLELDPVSRYTVTCTVSGAAQTPETTLIHMGETLYVRCTADGSHKAVGRVTAVSGTTYSLEVLGGELYVGEAVKLYREDSFSKDSCVGKGTVLTADTVSVSGEGKLLSLRVQTGDPVEKGQLLFTEASAQETGVIVPDGGLVYELSAAQGDTVREDQVLAVIARSVTIRFTADADDVPAFRSGQLLHYTRGDDPHETPHTATVLRVLQNLDDHTVTVELRPEEELPIGLSVEVTDD